MDEIVQRVEIVRERIEKAALRAGRRAQEINLIAVTKMVEPERILTAIKAGITDFGENRVQEAAVKIPALPQSVRWHFVGHLQSNKARKAVTLFDCIHSVDSPKLAERLDRISSEVGKETPVLIQVDLGGEPTKYGVGPEELMETAEQMAGLKRIQVIGLMAIPPYRENPEDVRPFFRQLAALLRELNERKIFPTELIHLSMGMSHDFEVAIEEGATMIRVGTAIFGERS